MSVMASDKRTQTYDIVRIGISTKYGHEQEMEFVCAQSQRSAVQLPW